MPYDDNNKNGQLNLNFQPAGHLFVAGVGPGDPQHLTLRVKSEIESASIIFVPKSEIKSESLALKIAGPYIPLHQNVQELVYPMTRDKNRLECFWHKAGNEVALWLKSHPCEKALYLSLGDPSIYSTWSYLKEALTVQGFGPSSWTVLPGVSSFTHGAALIKEELCIGNHNFCVIAMPQNRDEFEKYIGLFEVIVVMKIGKNWDVLRAWLLELGLVDYTFIVSRAGMENETALPLKEIAPDRVEYLSLAIINQKGKNA